MSKRTRIRLAAIGTLSAVVLTACGGGDEEAAGATAEGAGCADGLPLEDLVSAAQDEGEVVWYQVADPRTAEALGAAFEEEYGITATFTRAAGADLEQRFRAEQDSGAPSADVIVPLYGQFFEDTIDEGWVLPLSESGIPDFSTDGFPEAAVLENTVSVQSSAFGWGINADQAGGGNRPESWEDLVESEWQGKLLVPDLAASKDYLSYWYLVSEEYGMDFLDDIAGQIGRTYAGAVPATQALAAGEGAILAPGVAAAIEPTAAEGAPVEFVPSDPGLAVDSVIGVVEGAAHPCAARLFAHFLLSDAGIEAFNAPDGVLTPTEAEELGLTHQSPELEAEAAAVEDQIRAAFSG